MTTKHAETLPKMLPGAVIPQYVRCGRSGCKCGRGELHGPYYYRFWREHGCLRKAYIKPAELAAVRGACDEERRFLRLGRLARALGRQNWSRLAGLLKELQPDE